MSFVPHFLAGMDGLERRLSVYHETNGLTRGPLMHERTTYKYVSYLGTSLCGELRLYTAYKGVAWVDTE